MSFEKNYEISMDDSKFESSFEKVILDKIDELTPISMLKPVISLIDLKKGFITYSETDQIYEYPCEIKTDEIDP